MWQKEEMFQRKSEKTQDSGKACQGFGQSLKDCKRDKRRQEKLDF